MVIATKLFKQVGARALPKSYEDLMFFNIPGTSGRAGNSRALVEIIQQQPHVT